MVAEIGKETDPDGLDFSTVQILSQELGLPMEEINQYYQDSLKRLKAGARIKAFLPILASSQVREIVLKMKIRAEIWAGGNETSH